MTTSAQLNQQLTTALRLREEQTARDPTFFQRMALGELLALPRFSAFVDFSPNVGRSFCMFLNQADDGVALRVFWQRHYERFSLSLWGHLASQAGLAIDVGAHTGIYTLSAWGSIPENGEVISIEPYDINYARLMLNLRANGLPVQSLRQAAASDKEGQVKLSVNATPDYLSSGGRLGAQGAIEKQVTSVPLATFLRNREGSRVIIKIDVEGHEHPVLCGMRDSLNSIRPVIMVECLSAASAAKIDRLCEQSGYRRHVLDEERSTATEVLELASAVGLRGGDRNFLLSPPGYTDLASILARAQASAR